MEHRLTSKQLSPASILLDHMIDNIDTMLVKPYIVIDQTVSTTSACHQFEKMEQLKHDIIQQSIIIGRQMIQSFGKIVLDEKQKYTFNKDDDEFPSESQVAIINAIETRRLHTIECAKYITKQRLLTYFKQN